MNVQAAIGRPQPVKLTVDDFLLLRQSGAFAGFSRPELIDGELLGVPVQDEDEPKSDQRVPIKLRIEDYLHLDQAGAFSAYGKTELIDGVVYAMNPQHRAHGFAKDELAYRLRRALEAMGSVLHVATEQSVAIEPNSEPQPDIILTAEPRGAGAIPGASVALFVEIAATTAGFDLNEKARTYAAAGISEYWVLDVNRSVIHQMWSPEKGAFSERREVKLGERIEAATIKGLAVETAGIN
jgi:Uma2 family endonuclease